MKTSKDKFSITALLLTLVGVLFIGIVIVAGIILFNEKTIVVPSDGITTIQQGVDAADPGDIILVKASGGPYNEEVTIDKEKIKLIGIGKVKPVIDGTGLDDGSNGITIDSTSGVLVKNFRIQKFPSGLFGGGIGILLDASAQNIIKGNSINENEGIGIAVVLASAQNIIKGNTVNGNGIEGIFIFQSNRNTLKGNTVNNNTFEGIELNDSNSNMITRNTVNDNDRQGIELNDSNSNMIKGNTVQGNGFLVVSDGDGISLNDSNSNMIKGNNVKENSEDGIFLSVNSNDNDVFFNRAFGNGVFPFFDIENLGTNNFKGNKCDTSNQPNICN